MRGKPSSNIVRKSCHVTRLESNRCLVATGIFQTRKKAAVRQRQLHLSKLPNQILARPPTWRIKESEIRTKGGGGKMGIDGVPWTTYKNRGRHALSFAEQTLLIEHWGG